MGLVGVDVKIGVSQKPLAKTSEHPDYFQKNNGTFNTNIIEPIPKPTLGGPEVQLPDTPPSNCFIVFGRDRPRGLASGYGGRGNTHAGCIDIIAGLSGILSREVDAQGKLVATNKSPELDSARIYISQRADIDSPESATNSSGIPDGTTTAAVAVRFRSLLEAIVRSVPSPEIYSAESPN